MTESMLPAHFWDRVEKTDTCWLWLGGRTTQGYGAVSLNRRNLTAHRVVYMDLRGPIPLGLVLDHLCRVRHCCNPQHLEAVTHRENILRGVGQSALNVVKTHCPQGHEYTPENTYHHPSRPLSRRCRTCSIERARRNNIRYAEKIRERRNRGTVTRRAARGSAQTGDVR